MKQLLTQGVRIVIFYKYLPPERIDILQNRLIRFTQPNALNDPFEADQFARCATTIGICNAFAEVIRHKLPLMGRLTQSNTKTWIERFADKP